MYHLGASIKDLGKECFAISKVENEEMINLIKRVIQYWVKTNVNYVEICVLKLYNKKR